jgi:hypothetical protein
MGLGACQQYSLSKMPANKNAKKKQTNKRAPQQRAAPPPRPPQQPAPQRAPRPPKAPSTVSNLAALAGGALGGLFGQPALGATVGRLGSKFLGFGDYELQTNSLIPSVGSAEAGAPIPFFSKTGKRGIRVTEREYLGDVFSGPLVNGASAFTTTAYAINPAQSGAFPWLAAIAAEFEQWEPLGMVFEFRSTSSEFNGSSQALGTVILGTDYDPMAPLAPNKIILENMDYSDSCKASNNLMHGIECAPLERGDRLLLCRPGPITALGDSLRFYDLGNFQVATVGCSTANTNLGELWVSYDIAFYKKQIATVVTGNNLASYYRSTLNPSVADMFGTSAGSKVWGTIAMTRVGNVFTFPPSVTFGNFLVTLLINAATLTGFSATATSGCTLHTVVPDASGYWSGATTHTPLPVSMVGTGGALSSCFILTITAPSASITFACTALTGGSQLNTLGFTQISLSGPPVLPAT